jgi:hypothetical protein
MNNKPCIAFAGCDFYPRGGFNDFRGSFESIQQAKKSILEQNEDCLWDWWQVCTIENGSLVMAEKGRVKNLTVE